MYNYHTQSLANYEDIFTENKNNLTQKQPETFFSIVQTANFHINIDFLCQKEWHYDVKVHSFSLRLLSIFWSGHGQEIQEIFNFIILSAQLLKILILLNILLNGSNVTQKISLKYGSKIVLNHFLVRVFDRGILKERCLFWWCLATVLPFVRLKKILFKIKNNFESRSENGEKYLKLKILFWPTKIWQFQSIKFMYWKLPTPLE